MFARLEPKSLVIPLAAVILGGLVACSSPDTPNEPPGTSQGAVTGGAAAPEQPAAPAPADDASDAAAPPCFDVVLCIRGTHWSPTACACVPNDTPDACACDDGGCTGDGG